MADTPMIVANFDAMNAGAERIASTSTMMNNQLSDLKTQVSAVFVGEGGSWSGDAQAAYHGRQAEWDGAAEQLNLLLTQLSGAVTSSAETMYAADQRGVKAMGG